MKMLDNTVHKFTDNAKVYIALLERIAHERVPLDSSYMGPLYISKDMLGYGESLAIGSFHGMYYRYFGTELPFSLQL